MMIIIMIMIIVIIIIANKRTDYRVVGLISSYPGKLTCCFGKSPFGIGKSNISISHAQYYPEKMEKYGEFKVAPQLSS